MLMLTQEDPNDLNRQLFGDEDEYAPADATFGNEEDQEAEAAPVENLEDELEDAEAGPADAGPSGAPAPAAVRRSRLQQKGLAVSTG